jgi:uncharacterized protein YcfJ
MNRIAATALALALSAASGSALANHDNPYQADDRYGYGDDGRYDDRYGNDDRYRDHRYGRGYDMAQVISVDPIFAPGRRCRDDRYDRRYDDRYGRDYRSGGSSRANGAALGAMVGGALGNQAGKGDGRKAATIAGAVIGGVIGAEVAGHNERRYTYGHDNVYRCRDSYRGGYGYGDDRYGNDRYGNDSRYGRGYDDRVIGYNVTYRYAGRNYRTRMDHHPGRTIRVRVDVRPDGRRIAMGV